MHNLARLHQDAQLRTCALTLPEIFPSADEVRARFKKLCRRWSKRWRHVPALWKREPQKRGAMHYHLLISVEGLSAEEEEEFRKWLFTTWCEINEGPPEMYRVHFYQDEKRPWKSNWQTLRSSRFQSYFSKYLGKMEGCEGVECQGRWWGKINADRLPLADRELRQLGVREMVQVRRWMRKKKQKQAEAAIESLQTRVLSKALMPEFAASFHSFLWRGACLSRPDPGVVAAGVSILRKNGIPLRANKLRSVGTLSIVCDQANDLLDRMVAQARLNLGKPDFRKRKSYSLRPSRAGLGQLE